MFSIKGGAVKIHLLAINGVGPPFQRYSFLILKQVRNPGMVQKRIANSNGRTSDRQTEGLINIQADVF